MEHATTVWAFYLKLVAKSLDSFLQAFSNFEFAFKELAIALMFCFRKLLVYLFGCLRESLFKDTKKRSDGHLNGHAAKRKNGSCVAVILGLVLRIKDCQQICRGHRVGSLSGFAGANSELVGSVELVYVPVLFNNIAMLGHYLYSYVH